MEWNDKLIKDIERTIGRRVQAAGLHLASRIKRNISIAVRNGVRSKPGEFPRRETGLLRQSITSKFTQATLTARVGTDLNYGRFLETGTSKMLPRPWLLRTLAQERSTIIDIIKGTGPKSAK